MFVRGVPKVGPPSVCRTILRRARGPTHFDARRTGERQLGARWVRCIVSSPITHPALASLPQPRIMKNPLHAFFLFGVVPTFTACTGNVSNNSTPPAVTAPTGCGPVLTNDKAWYTSGKRAFLLPGLSGLHYPITTRSDSAQRFFDQGLVLAYGFNHAEAARSFWEATRIDRTCAMAWWGFAYVLGPRAWNRTATSALIRRSRKRRR